MKEANVKIHIKNFEDLMYFLSCNYEHIDEESYKALLENTLFVFAMTKPLNKESALAELEEFYYKYPENVERPFFIHLENEQKENI